jgi:hypothetical protein
MRAGLSFLVIWAPLSVCPNLMAASVPGEILLAQADTSAPFREKLQEQNPIDLRRKTVVPIPVPGAGAGEAALNAPTNPQEADKLMRVQRLIADIEKRRGTAPGTVNVRSAKDGGISLEHDLSKMRGNFIAFGASPFGGDVPALPDSPHMSAVVTPAEVEYRVEQSHAGGEQVVGVRSGGDVAATAFKSGEELVRLEVATAGLTARQIEGTGEELPVLVSVGDQSQQLRPGDAARFGKLEVVIQVSSNKSARRTSIEGPPYALRLRIQSIQ